MGSKLWILLIILFPQFLCSEIRGQNLNYCFKDGEYALYGAYYNWNFIWIQSGEVEFHADTMVYKNQPAWHLKALGKTYKAYDLLYIVRDTFETYCNYKSFQPIDSRRIINHGKDNSQYRYSFDYQKAQIQGSIHQHKKPAEQLSLPTQENTFDLLATAYNFRMFNFDKLFIGEKVPYRMLIDRKVEDLFFRYLGTEIIKTRNGKKYRCQKVSVYLLQGDFFPEGEYMKIWFTDDKNHLPVQVESKILIGSVKALLLDTKSIKYPLTSLIK
jgi:hypothetical protein